MTFHLVHSDSQSLLASDRAVIKRDERVDFTDAVALLHAAAAIREKSVVAAEQARAAARAEGLAEARETIAAELTEQIAGLAAAVDLHESERRNDVAQAAYAAVRAIIGELDDETLLLRLAERTLTRLPAEGPVTIQVATEMVDRLQPRLAGLEHVTVVADHALGATDCVIRTSAGQVIASLSVQLDSLAKRWGLAA